jgi:hypothetical protein
MIVNNRLIMKLWKEAVGAQFYDIIPRYFLRDYDSYETSIGMAGVPAEIWTDLITSINQEPYCLNQLHCSTNSNGKPIKSLSCLHIWSDIKDEATCKPSRFSVCTSNMFPGVKRPGREADHSPSTSAEVKKMWIYTSTPPYAFMA